ncbi:DNA-processing protein DprA [Marinobacter sp. Arc7-DN-1]|uniref:DNA-processing protein DprA n=1 Tax=Marinobacter sp. Arc7-DN-1 TaxID=2304594 RepID=UPI000E432474|nr:DNA-processing protein DprA [Marinobacter sp. Arc7-DN-1]AXS84635.1 DNA-processing protein DprA [Marinobacter sp. Arc7-DN-1]
MNLSHTAQATLLLTSYFSKAASEQARPLTNKEWGRFALWLRDHNSTPADLLKSDPLALLKSWHDAKITHDRIVSLLNRGHSLALAVEKWQRAGLWVVTRSDKEYPVRLKQRLKTDSPPVLFGCGNKALLNSGGLAVVGSRSANEEDLQFTQRVGAKAASEGIAIVSGGARGVDETAMLGAIDQSGPVIGVMADSLLKAATSAKWRKGLMDGNLVLVSPFYPEAGFSAGNAMARNKYIYCLADSSLVVHSGKKGGTLNGAQENLKHGWVPLWVKPTDDPAAANADLVNQGGYWCERNLDKLSVRDLWESSSVNGQQVKEGTDLFADQQQPPLFAAREEAADFSTDKEESSVSVEPADFYQLFLRELGRLAEEPVTAETLTENTGLHKTQVNEWLKRAVDEGQVNKLSRPVRYQFIKAE